MKESYNVERGFVMPQHFTIPFQNNQDGKKVKLCVMAGLSCSFSCC
jgi:hypothetical protein